MHSKKSACGMPHEKTIITYPAGTNIFLSLTENLKLDLPEAEELQCQATDNCQHILRET